MQGTKKEEKKEPSFSLFLSLSPLTADFSSSFLSRSSGWLQPPPQYLLTTTSYVASQSVAAGAATVRFSCYTKGSLHYKPLRVAVAAVVVVVVVQLVVRQTIKLRDIYVR